MDLSIVLLVIIGVSCVVGQTGGVSEGDPAPGRSPGPPSTSPGYETIPTLLLSTMDSTEENNQVSSDGTPEGDKSDCPHVLLAGDDLIVVDKTKAAVMVNVTHSLFSTEVLTTGLTYQVLIFRRPDDNNLVWGVSLHSVVNGEPDGMFSGGPVLSPPCLGHKDMASSVTANLDQPLIYNWSLPVNLETATYNVTFRLRYKVHSSPSVFQVNYEFAVHRGCEVWLRDQEGSITWLDLPRHQSNCRIYFPKETTRQPSDDGHGVLLRLTRLNVPCSEGHLLFTGTANTTDYLPKVCGKLEELREVQRTVYFPGSEARPPHITSFGRPVFSFSYRLVDHCHNVSFSSPNATYQLNPTRHLDCSFRIHLPYGNKVILRLEISGNGEDSGVECRKEGLQIELWDGSSSWSHCSRPSDKPRNFELESRDNRVLMSVRVRTLPNTLGRIRLKFSYRAGPMQEIVGRCPYGWVSVRQACVTVFETAGGKTWPDAEQDCISKGGHLASVRSEHTQRIIDNMLINSPGYRDENAYWLGATDVTYEGDFRWSDGLPFTYTNWFPGWSQHGQYNRQPNDDGLSEQDCVEVRRSYHLPQTMHGATGGILAASGTVVGSSPVSPARLAPTFMWNDRDCLAKNHYICQAPVQPHSDILGDPEDSEDSEDADWYVECVRSLTLTRTRPRGVITSPAYPRHYPDNARCVTTVTAPQYYRLIVDFEELVLEKEPYCSYDYLEIWEPAGGGTAGNESRTRRLCGDWSSKLKLLRYVSLGPRLQLTFVSDYSHHYGGFKARISMENAIQCSDDRQIMFNNSCYLFVSYPEVTWSTADQICRGMRAELASVISPEEHRFIISNIRKSAEYRTGSLHWLGGTTSKDRFVWTDGSEMKFTAWLPGKNEIKNKDNSCLAVQWTASPSPLLSSGLYWKVHRCSSTGGYVCKRKNLDITPLADSAYSQMNLNRTVNGSEGRITSPNYPTSYYNNLDFSVRIIGPERTRLVVQFSRIDLEPQLDCLYDYVQVSSVGDPADAVRWCGNHDTDMQRFDFVSRTNEAILTFHSDYSVTGSGFSATWQAVDVSGCPLQTLTAREGIITSPNYPHFLLARLDCAITILAPPGRRVWLEIQHYDMNGESSNGEGFSKSSEAVLELDLGGESTAFRPFQVGGQLTDGAFVSIGERLQVRLRTGDHPKGSGFKAIYRTINGDQEKRIVKLENSTTGVLLYLNYPAFAPNGLDYVQHFVAPLGNVILLELHGVQLGDKCQTSGRLEIIDNYADANGTAWKLCKNEEIGSEEELASAPLSITSYLNTLHIRQIDMGAILNGTLRVQPDPGYKVKLVQQRDTKVESCEPNPCLHDGKCLSTGSQGRCQCPGQWTGLMCALTVCELAPCVFGECSVTGNGGYKCKCQAGYNGPTCDQKQRPCEGNPCESRGDCIERGESFQCRCHAWWEGPRCEKRMMHIPFRPLSERMFHEPFWLGLMTVTVVLAVIGLVWCARRHFPEKLEKLLAEDNDRSRFPGPSLRYGGPRTLLHGNEHLTASAGSVTTQGVTVNSSGAAPSPQQPLPRGIFGRLGIRKPSILSLTSHHSTSSQQQEASGSCGGNSDAAPRTFSLDDLLKPHPRRTPSPRKKRNNSTPTKKNAAEKKQILQQLVSPGITQRSRKVSIGELIQLSERKFDSKDSETSDGIRETSLDAPVLHSGAQVVLTDPKLEKKVTFARLLNKVSAEMSSGSDAERERSSCSGMMLRPASTPPSPAAAEFMRSPNSTSSNQGSDSLSSSEVALSGYRVHDVLQSRRKLGGQLKPASADSILQMFRSFSTSSAAANYPSLVISPSTTPTASTPQDDVAGDDDSTTSSIQTPVSSCAESPTYLRRLPHTTIEVPVLDALSAQRDTNLLHPPTILLEVPSIGTSGKCLSPIRELPTPLPSPLPSPRPTHHSPPVLQRSNASSSAEDLGLDFSDDRISIELPCGTGTFSDGDDDEIFRKQDIVIDIHAEDGLIQEEAAVMQQACLQFKNKPRPPPLGSNADTSSSKNSSFDSQSTASKPAPLIIPKLMVQQPSPTHTKPPGGGIPLVPGSPPPQRLPTNHENIFHFSERPGSSAGRRLLKELDKPTSLDLPWAPPMITVTCNLSEAESDADSPASVALKGGSHLMPTTVAGMCYLSPFSMCSRADRTASESNLSSSGYSSMASPGPSRCGSNNPLCPSEMEDPGPSGGCSRKSSPLLRSNATTQRNSGSQSDQKGSCRGRSDSETLSDDPLLESNDEGIGTDHLDEKIDDGELKSAKELEIYIDTKMLDVPTSPNCANGKCEVETPMDRLLIPPVQGVCKVQLQLPSIVVQSESSDKYVSPVSSRSESPLSDRTFGMGLFSPHFYNKQNKDFLPFTDSDGLYDFPSSDCTAQNKISLVPTIQHRKSGRRREKKSSRTKSQSPTKNVSIHHHLDVPGGKDIQNSCRNQMARKPSPKRRAARCQQQNLVSSSSSSESLTSARELHVCRGLNSSSSPSPDTIRWASPTNQWPQNNIRVSTPRSSGDDTAEDTSSTPYVSEDLTKQTKKISKLRAISNQIRFLRRLEKSLKQKERLQLRSRSDSGDEEEEEEDNSRVTSPLLQSSGNGPKAEIKKNLVGVPQIQSTRFKRGKAKKGSDLLIPQEENTWNARVIVTGGDGGNHSD